MLFRSNITATGSNKTYDGSNAATVALTGNGVLPGDQLSFTDGSATFASPNAGNGIAIAVSGINGSGADLGNYTFNNTATTAANIAPAILNLNGMRTYDGATDASASLFDVALINGCGQWSGTVLLEIGQVVIFELHFCSSESCARTDSAPLMSP